MQLATVQPVDPAAEARSIRNAARRAALSRLVKLLTRDEPEPGPHELEAIRMGLNARDPKADAR